MHPRLDARTLGQTHRFGFHGAPKASAAMQALQFVVLLLDIDMRIRPIVLDFVQLTILDQQLLIETSPGAQ